MSGPNRTLALTVEEGGVGVIGLDRPHKRNALDAVMHHELLAALDGWAEDDTVSCVMLYGTEEIFCAGWDLSVLEGLRGGERSRFTDLACKLMTALYDYRKPTVAAVAGMAPGYGMDVANMCDVTVASENARFSSTQVKYGMAGFYGGLQRKVGPMRARRMFFTGDAIDVREAHRIGLVDEVAPLGGLREQALDTARRIAAMGPEMSTILKEVALRAQNMDHIGGIAYELRVTHDLTQRQVFQERTPAGLQRIREGDSAASERTLR
ncbi:MAG TPA: enoyl-CoA hydratase/isomerase family protein [Solirubrobacteraceae bacterium]|nr:enoyl-CoA hydratase/isomerase family protein [Solirubrobacteraceae bacterium]